MIIYKFLTHSIFIDRRANGSEREALKECNTLAVRIFCLCIISSFVSCRLVHFIPSILISNVIAPVLSFIQFGRMDSTFSVRAFSTTTKPLSETSYATQKCGMRSQASRRYCIVFMKRQCKVKLLIFLRKKTIYHLSVGNSILDVLIVIITRNKFFSKSIYYFIA